MKALLKTTILATFTMAILFGGCKKDGYESTDFVNDYNPTLTEPIGTKYTGDYFPIGANYTWNYTSNMTWNDNIKQIFTNGNSNTIIKNGAENTNYSKRFGNTEAIPVNGVIKTLYPSYNETTDETYYFEKTLDGIYKPAHKYKYASYYMTAVKIPLYIKTPLIVGDKWETDTQLEDFEIDQILADYYTSEDNLSIKNLCYVIGKEEKTWKGTSYNTIRLDQLVELNINVEKIYLEGQLLRITHNVKATIKNYLIKDIGLVFQDIESTVTISYKYLIDDYREVITTTNKRNSTLDSCDFNNSSAYLSSRCLKSKQTSQKTYSNDESINKLMNQHVELSNRIINRISIK